MLARGGICILLAVVLIGLTSAANLKKPAAATAKKECVDNTLYEKFVCTNQKDGAKFLVPGSCSDYYECSKGISQKKSCSKFYDPESKKCVSKSSCVEVDDTNCVIPTPPPCNAKPSTPEPCECPELPPTVAPPTCPPIVTCPTVPTCPPPTECPAPVECPEPPVCPTPEPPPTESSCKPIGPGPCNSYYNPEDLYSTFACREKKDGTLLIVPNNCSEYLICMGGWSYLKSCGSELYFNPLVGACDKKSELICPSDSKPNHL